MKKEVKSIKKKITDLYFEQIINCIKFAAQNIVPPPPNQKKKRQKKAPSFFGMSITHFHYGEVP